MTAKRNRQVLWKSVTARLMEGIRSGGAGKDKIDVGSSLNDKACLEDSFCGSGAAYPYVPDDVDLGRLAAVLDVIRRAIVFSNTQPLHQ